MTVKRNITLTTGSGSSIFPDAGTFLSFAAISRTRSTVSPLFYVCRFQGKLPVSPTMSTFIALRRHRPHRPLSSSLQFRHSFSSVPHDDTSRLAANSSSIVFDPTAVGSLYATFAIDLASPYLFAFVHDDDHWCDHTLRPSTSPPPFLRQRISFSSSLYKSLHYHLHESAALLVTSYIMGRVLCHLLWGRQGPPRGVRSRGTYYFGACMSSCYSLLPILGLLSLCHFYFFQVPAFYVPSCCFITIFLI